MTTLAQLAQTQGANPLAQFSTYNDQQFANDPSQTASGAQFLAALQKYDPNAGFYQVNGAAQPGVGDGGSANAGMYQLRFDPSKLPNVGGTGQLGAASPWQRNFNYGGQSVPYSSGYAPNWVESAGRTDLINPSAVANSPVYGQITSRNNIQAQQPGLIDYLGPLLTLAAGGIGAAGGLSGVFGGIASANPVGAAVASGIEGMGQSGGNPMNLLPAAGQLFGLPAWAAPVVSTGINLARGGTFNPLSLVAYALGAAGAPGWVAPALQLGAGLLQGRQINPIGAGLTLAQLAASRFGGGGSQ